MLLYDRRKLLLTTALAPLAGCGFTPLFDSGGAAAGIFGMLRFNLIESREGFLLLDRLESRFGAAGNDAVYDVKIELIIEEKKLTLTAATSLERVTVNGAAILTVVDTRADAEVFADKLRETTGYTSSSETAVTVSSRRDARDRLVNALADQIVNRLAATAPDWAK